MQYYEIYMRNEDTRMRYLVKISAVQQTVKRGDFQQTRVKMAMVSIATAPEAWKLLNGIVCIFKPPRVPYMKMKQIFVGNLCQDLNQMKTRPPSTFVEFRKVPKSGIPEKEYGRNPIACVPAGDEKIEIVTGINFADHPLVVGPRYANDDVRLCIANPLGTRVSGVTVVGINQGVGTAKRIKYSQWMKTYEVSGRFGMATDNKFDDGKIIEKTTFHKINKLMLERTVSLLQANYQKQMFNLTGVPMGSQLAYDLASKGALRPENPTIPVIYALKVTQFDLPNFTIEIKVINETQDYLTDIIASIGLKLHSTSVCTKLRCVKYGPFELQHALLAKHWTTEHVIRNIIECQSIVKHFNLRVRDPVVRGSIAPIDGPEDSFDSQNKLTA